MPTPLRRNRPAPAMWLTIAVLIPTATADGAGEPTPSPAPAVAPAPSRDEGQATTGPGDARQTPVAASNAAATQEMQKASAPEVKIGGLWYLSYQGLDADPGAFLIKRGYINLETRVLPFMSARITPDVTLDAAGDLKVRLKYAYAKFHLADVGFLTRPDVEVGVAHAPWLDFEEHINLYRMQDTMFMERNGLLNSADFGVTFMALLAGTISNDEQTNIGRHYPGRWGSMAIGVYNGSGYHAAEKNHNKVFEGRLTVRPLPDALPGLQVSLLNVTGKGNLAAEPDWKVSAVMTSYQSPRVTLTAQWTDAAGNQNGTAVSPLGRSLDRDGWSVFVEGKMTPHWSTIARVDRFDPDTAATSDENVRTIAGVAYHLGHGNTVLVDLERESWHDSTRPTTNRLQLTLQVKY